jgi:uncharacterized spore protein YtfJ
MSPDELLEKAADALGVRRVFGEPVERDGVLVIPVAVAVGGGGGGTAPEGQGEGGGFGGLVRAIGVYELREGRVRFVPALDVTALAVIALVAARGVARALRVRAARKAVARR